MESILMANIVAEYCSLEELCLATELSSDIIVEIVEQGIIAPMGQNPEEWEFTTHMIVITKKAYRLHTDLDIDWAGIALAISLIDELEKLRQENRQLQQQLGRFGQIKG
jgi:chaperone modulatory protein CbpM